MILDCLLVGYAAFQIDETSVRCDEACVPRHLWVIMDAIRLLDVLKHPVVVNCRLFWCNTVCLAALRQLTLYRFRRDLFVRREAERGSCLRVVEDVAIAVMLHLARHLVRVIEATNSAARDAAALLNGFVYFGFARGTTRRNVYFLGANSFISCSRTFAFSSGDICCTSCNSFCPNSSVVIRSLIGSFISFS